MNNPQLDQPGTHMFWRLQRLPGFRTCPYPDASCVRVAMVHDGALSADALPRIARVLNG